MGSGAVGELHAGTANRRPNRECLGRSCLASKRKEYPVWGVTTGLRASPRQNLGALVERDMPAKVEQWATWKPVASRRLEKGIAARWIADRAARHTATPVPRWTSRTARLVRLLVLMRLS